MCPVNLKIIKAHTAINLNMRDVVIENSASISTGTGATNHSTDV